MAVQQAISIVVTLFLMTSLPAIFLSHGAPDLPIRDGAVTHFLKSLHRQFPKPQAILVVSAHWNSIEPTVSKAIQPQTIYDFGGFPEAVYKLNYSAPGAPEIADSPDGEASPTSRQLTYSSWDLQSYTS